MKRVAAVFAVLLCAASVPVEAQRSRITIVPTYSHLSLTPLFEYNAVNSSYQTDASVEVDDTRTYGILVAYHVTDSWRIYGDVRWGKSAYDYRQRSGTPDDDLFDTLHVTWSSNVTVLEFGIGRVIQAGASGPTLEAGLGGVVHRVRLNSPDVGCGGPPSLGLPPCGPDFWVSNYDVPGIAFSLSLNQQIWSRFGIRLGSSYSIGRADVSRFSEVVFPGSESGGPPTTYGVRAVKLSGGISITL